VEALGKCPVCFSPLNPALSVLPSGGSATANDGSPAPIRRYTSTPAPTLHACTPHERTRTLMHNAAIIGPLALILY